MAHSETSQGRRPTPSADALPKSRYRTLIIGNGLAALETAHALAGRHGRDEIAVLCEMGSPSPSSGIVADAPNNAPTRALYDLAVTRWETLSKTLATPNLYAPGRVIIPACTRRELADVRARFFADKAEGRLSEFLDREQAQEACGQLLRDGDGVSSVLGAVTHALGGLTEPDRVAKAYTDALHNLNVDVVGTTTITGLTVEPGRNSVIETDRGSITAETVALLDTPGMVRLTGQLGLDLPLTSGVRQILVTAPIQRVSDRIFLGVGGGTLLAQRESGEIIVEADLSAGRNAASEALALMPGLSRVMMQPLGSRQVFRTADGGGIFSCLSGKGLYVATGWGTASEVLAPAIGETLAHLMANGVHSDLSRPFDASRFKRRIRPLEGAA